MDRNARWLDQSGGTNDFSCGGATGGLVGERWPDDQSGRLQGAKYDSRQGRLAAQLGVDPRPPEPDGPRVLFDLMSYCSNRADAGAADTAASSGNAWISARNWIRFYEELVQLAGRVGTADRPPRVPAGAARAAQAPAGRRPAAAGAAFAVGIAGPAGGHVMRVVPPDGGDAIPASEPSSPVRLRSLAADGRVLLDAGVRAEVSSEAPPGAPGTFVGPVSADAAAVELVRGGRLLHRRERTRPPSIKLLAPRLGARVGGRGSLTVRWSASDPDGDSLKVAIDYSPDGGRTWRTVYGGENRGSFRVFGRFLAASRDARVRVAVSDGFNQTSVRSVRFRADGTPPAVRIVRPIAGEQLSAGERARLVASAADDQDRPLLGKAITWFAGRRRLGSGAELLARLPAGRYALRALARDATGRAGVARVNVRVAANRLALVRLDHPSRVKRGAHTVTVSVAASAPATLRAAGRRYRITTRTRRFALPLPSKPARGVVRVPFTLVPRGGDVVGRIRGRVEVFRGRA